MEFNRWQMEFNVDKCHIMHIGSGNQEFKYYMGNQELQPSAFVMDIGVLIQPNLRPSLQCAKAAKTANAVLGQISRAESYRDKETFLKLFRTYVRPHLEYCVATWSPWTEGEKNILEKVQKRAISMVTNFKGRSYEEKLTEAGMVTLVERRRRGDLLQAYRVFNGVDNVDPGIWFSSAQVREGATATRQTSGFMNVTRGEGRIEIRENVWSQRVIDPWNNLPNQVKESETFNNNLHFKVTGGQR